MGVDLGRAGGGAGRFVVMMNTMMNTDHGLWPVRLLLARFRSSECIFMQENVQEAGF